ncbi:MAG: YdiU family protein [Myxococcales bacterium FL481]|nr:MAG: YdiU family protein [Myxococcales bacterium FL481]
MPNERPSSEEQDLITGSGFRFDTQYTQLPSVFYRLGDPSHAPQPKVVVVNDSLAQELGLRLESLASETKAALFSGQILPNGSIPFSQAYAGHQFGGFTMLGDGRAHVLGEHLTPTGRRVDIQLKGSGRTPYSRGGDGRATLGPMLREYVISEAMAALNVPTTRSLAVVTTGARVLRDQPLPGAILTRVAASHIRIGTFEFAAALDEPKHLRQLLNHAVDRHYPELARASSPALALWDVVAKRQAALVAAWMRVGFVHGVMNTDNVTLSGETIDYGPCAFIDSYAAATVFSSIDEGGRYAFGNQPWIARWNLARFAETLLPLIDDSRSRAVAIAEERLAQFQTWMNEAWTEMMRDKLGLPGQREDDRSLATDLLELMEETSADYTNTFRALSAAAVLPPELERARGWEAWRARWDARCERARGDEPGAAARDRMRHANPAIIPRNYLVEEALDAAVESADLGPFQRLVAAVQTPYEEQPDLAPFQAPPPDSFRNYQTFCGT